MERAEQLKAAANDHYRARRFSAAISGYDAAVNLCERFPLPPRELLSVLFSNRAAAKLECQDYRGAVDDARAASTLNRKNMKAYYREADALRRLGGKHHLAGACQAAGRALRTDRHNPEMMALMTQVKQLYEQAGGSLAALDPELDSGQLQDFVKPAMEMYKAAERSYLLSFSTAKQNKWIGPGQAFKAHHYYQYGEVGLTLAGIKPATVFAHGSDLDFGREIASAAMQPVMQQFQLEQKGFRLSEIKHKMLTSNPAHPGFQGGWVLVNTNHPEFDLVKAVFLQPWPGGRVPEEKLGRAFGYPLPAGDADIEYFDATESEVHGLCCVPVLDFCCPANLGMVDWNKLSRHYKQCERVFKLLGRQLSFSNHICEEVHTYTKWLHAVESQL